MTFWFAKCAGHPAEPEIIATKLKERLRRYDYKYVLHAQMQSLQMVSEWPKRGLQTACAFACRHFVRISSGNMSPIGSRREAIIVGLCTT